jgi:1-acyl-sn-glycerol-3-phosphate acyltransferase
MKDQTIPTPNMFVVRLLTVICRITFKIYFRLECKGCKKLGELARQKRPLILVANHASNLDAAMVGTCAGAEFTSRFSTPGKRELLDDWRISWFMRALGLFPVDREAIDLSAARTILRILRAGRCIGIAPEGTRSLTGEVQPFKTGFVKLALQTNAAILPVGIQRTHEALPKGAIIPRPRKIVLRFGNVIDLSSYIAQQPKHVTDKELAEMIRQEVIRLCEGRKE